jgi:hypothetical protein
VVILGSLGFRDRYLDVVGGIALKALRAKHRPVLVVMDATWEQNSTSLSEHGLGRFAPLVARFAVRALDGPHVVYCVLSDEERCSFASRWRVDPDRVALTLYHPSGSVEAWAARASDRGYLFAGGDPLRDYDLLLAATDGLDVPLRIASRRFQTEPRPGLDVRAVDPETFRVLEAGARAVVVPLRAHTGRSAGQQTYLSALALGKPLIITDAPGVRDYIMPGRHALVVPARPEDLRDAICHVLDPKNAEEVAQMAENGRRWVRSHFSFARYRTRVAEITSAAISTHRRGRIDLAPIAQEKP